MGGAGERVTHHPFGLQWLVRIRVAAVTGVTRKRNSWRPYIGHCGCHGRAIAAGAAGSGGHRAIAIRYGRGRHVERGRGGRPATAPHGQME